MTSARWVACQVLLDVESGEPSDRALEKRTRELDSRDAGLATEIALGVLRRKNQLDWYIGEKAGPRLDPEVRIALEIGMYQRIFLTRVPAHAAVSESVELVRAFRLNSAAGLVNAILRRLPLRIVWPNRAIELAMPAWLLAGWDRIYGAAQTDAIAREALKPPVPYVHVPPDLTPPEAAEPTDVPGCFQLAGPAPERLRRMDIGSQAVARLLDAQRGDLVLDLCAAPGNKSALLQEVGAQVVACDASPRRLADLLTDCPRVLLDARLDLPFRPIFDRILVDAPCSGTGTLARNPEIKWRLGPESVARHADRQQQMLQQALRVLKPGGTLVYATCSLEREENHDVVFSVAPSRVRRTVERLPGREPGDGFRAAVLS